MRILIGVRFLYPKVLVLWDLSTQFNERRLCNDLKTVAAEPVLISQAKPFNDRYVDMSTFLGGMSIFTFTVSKPVHQPLIYAVGVQIVFILKFTEWA